MKELNILDTAIRSGVFQTFTRLLEGSTLEQKLRTESFFTLFAPLDIAFAYLSPVTLHQLLRAENQGKLADVLGYHCLSRQITSHQLQHLESAQTICGLELVITSDEGLRVNGARILHLDIYARNGVIHGIDRLLLPTLKTQSARA